MSPRTARPLAVPFVVLAFALRVSESLWLEPYTWGMEPDALGLLTAFALFLGALALPLGIYLLLTRRVRALPPAWQVDTGRRRFFADPAPVSKGWYAIVLGWLAAGAIPMERVPHEERRRIAELGAFTTVSVTLAVLVLLLAVILVLVNRPSLALDRDGVTVQGYLRRTSARWEDAPEFKVPRRGLGVTPQFLAFTIRAYHDDPAAREQIGTRAEADRLESAHRS